MLKLSAVILLAIFNLMACSQSVEPYRVELAGYDRADQDRDGVINQRDLCVDTESGAEIDNNGCAAYQLNVDSYELMVFFENDSSQLKREFEPQLQQVAEFMRRYPQVEIGVEGYASASGRADYNLQLSRQRAKAVSQVLVERFQISEQRIQLQPMGESQQLVDDDSPQAAAANRRVRIFVQQQYRNVVPKWTIYTSQLKP
ncbi:MULTISPECIES: OmpA family protein [unclassified Agarivorans]|uniref:OmpA family protein n=1 Tax=unclassified Agarivorans TaxID=2636026 RepID=UPI003D7CB3CD